MSESSAKLASVVDTNLFVSGAISPHGSPGRLLRALYDQRFDLLLSDQLYAEIIDVMRRPKLVTQFRLTVLEATQLFAGLDNARRIEPSPTVPIQLRDPNDDKILAAALGGNADYLVTGDNDLLVHRDDPRLGQLRIVTVAEFLATLDTLAPARAEESWGSETPR